jgi:carbamoyltransferase
MVILGINAYHGDASAALVVDGELIAAAEEERFSRVKHVAGFPSQAVRYCLQAGGVGPEAIDHVGIPRDPRVQLFSKALHALRAPSHAVGRLKALARFGEGIRSDLARALGTDPGAVRADFINVEHHRAHLASAFFVSPFEEAALVSLDGLGDFASTMWGVGSGSHIAPRGVVTFPHSLGIFYTALTQFLGFWKYGDEYKVMGLASYGAPDFRDEFSRIVRLDGGGFSLGLEYFRHHRDGVDMTWRSGAPTVGRLFSPALEELLGPARAADDSIRSRDKAVAASLQARLEDVFFHILRSVHAETGLDRLCLAGGVAFNCVANGRIFDETPFRHVFVQPAAGDAGLAVGAAFHIHHEHLRNPRKFVMRHAYWGPAFDDAEVRKAVEGVSGELKKLGAVWRSISDEEELVGWAADRIADGKVVGWFQGRMEWGPRALGNRSILVDPRRADMRDLLNARIKHREPFRPFAPSILAERSADYFVQSHPSPFMQMTYTVRPEKRGEIPAPTHVDGTGRLQTVEREANPRYWSLIRAFELRTGVPVLLNTSLNENEPIVCTPAEALDCFLRTEMDALVLGDLVMEKGRGGA